MDIEERWNLVKQHYEKCYKIQFKRRLKDEDIHFLFRQMQKLQEEIEFHTFCRNSAKVPL